VKTYRKVWVSNLLMAVILFVVAIKHAIALLNIRIVLISSHFATDILFILGMLLFIFIVTILIFYLPMFMIIKLEFHSNFYLPPIVVIKSNVKQPLQRVFTPSKSIYLQFQVIRC